MHRIALILLLIGIVASIGVANAYNGYALGSYNDGFSSGGPGDGAGSADAGPVRRAYARGRVDKTYKGVSVTARDWAASLGRYAPWMEDFEISAGLAARHASNVTGQLLRNARAFSGYEYTLEGANGRPGNSASPALGGYQSWSGGSSGGSSGSGSTPDRHAEILARLAAGGAGQDVRDDSPPRIWEEPSDRDHETTPIQYVAVRESVKELIPGVITQNGVQNPPGGEDAPIANPEPCTLLLGGLGLAGLALAGRRGRNNT
ncbi:MAG: hypothetical protein ACOZEN_14910 [Thermodesulfobacteriota bacterium]